MTVRSGTPLLAGEHTVLPLRWATMYMTCVWTALKMGMSPGWDSPLVVKRVWFIGVTVGEDLSERLRGCPRRLYVMGEARGQSGLFLKRFYA